jgi:predicted RNA-binding Zn-ribbon protein involved in translation (DUF1610 family)
MNTECAPDVGDPVPRRIICGMGVQEPTLHGTCVACPKCGVWIVNKRAVPGGKQTVNCPECGNAFVFEYDRARVYPLRQSLYERGYFYPSEVRES